MVFESKLTKCKPIEPEIDTSETQKEVKPGALPGTKKAKSTSATLE